MLDHTFTTGDISKRKYQNYELYGYPKRYKKPRWTFLLSAMDAAQLLHTALNTRRFKEPYNFKITKIIGTYVYTPVSMQELMLIRIKEGI